MERPKCRCAERREAMARATKAAIKGDYAAAQQEWDFIRNSSREDAEAMMTYLKTVMPFGPSADKEKAS